MADISPFAGLRYAADRVGDLASVLCPPYDVISDDERGQLEARHPENVVRLELPRGADDTRYATAARLLASWTAEGILRPDARESFYVYEQQFGYAGQRYTRRGFFAAVRLEPFERRVVLPHEKTLSAPKEDRRRLLRATRTQISPVFGLYRDAERGGARHHRRGGIGRARSRRDDHRRRSSSPVANHLGGGDSTACGCCSPTSRS